MPNHLSPKRRIRSDARKGAANNVIRSRCRTLVKHFNKSLGDSNHASILEKFNVAQSALMRAVSKGVLHKKNSSRRVSRMHMKMKKIMQN